MELDTKKLQDFISFLVSRMSKIKTAKWLFLALLKIIRKMIFAKFIFVQIN